MRNTENIRRERNLKPRTENRRETSRRNNHQTGEVGINWAAMEATKTLNEWLWGRDET